jgi:hypothetical protein
MSDATTTPQKFTDIKDDNGTTLQSYAELLAEKAKNLGFAVIIVLGSQERDMVHTISTLGGSVPDALIALGTNLKAEQNTVKAN